MKGLPDNKNENNAVACISRVLESIKACGLGEDDCRIIMKMNEIKFVLVLQRNYLKDALFNFFLLNLFLV